MRVSGLQAKGRQHHLSQNIGPVIAGSVRPALPALSSLVPRPWKASAGWAQEELLVFRSVFQSSSQYNKQSGRNKESRRKMALLQQHTFAFSCLLHGCWAESC